MVRAFLWGVLQHAGHSMAGSGTGLAAAEPTWRFPLLTWSTVYVCRKDVSSARSSSTSEGQGGPAPSWQGEELAVQLSGSNVRRAAERARAEAGVALRACMPSLVCKGCRNTRSALLDLE
eukprot:CAMPEP_0197888382 /NCGR_PEP_ID=MMETSP1439-20131203/21959_1 /TAXON_ID=66791 /ORGANISM="Gonyaulax spinifera, Strain CCMP409" /LENGTH=119 /DNA_ID=CAMNT_0043508291 /DNA_START=175 /DNA_END=533 /DNA_ORIENTATION=+